MSYNLSISCPFNVKLKFKGAKFHTRNLFFNHEFVYLMILKFLDVTDMQNKQKIF